MTKELIADAHSALQDCKLTYLILLKVLEAVSQLDSFEKLAEQCRQPSVRLPAGIQQNSYTKEYSLTFGKYCGTPFSDVNKVHLVNYLTWLVDKAPYHNKRMASSY